jgi:hypothetical protein
MIQRIQSLFLLIAFLAAAALFFYPLAGIYSQMETYEFYVYGFKNLGEGSSVISFMTTFPVLLLNILVAAFSIGCIFIYKNRITQMKIVRLAILLEIIFLALVFFVYEKIIETKLHATYDEIIWRGIYAKLISLVFLVLAYRSIMKDEKLVRSVDRLR